MSVSPIRCVPIARWLNVGSRSSMACPPFLNCARAFPAKPPSATASPAHEINSLLIHTLLFDREPLLGAIPHTAVVIDGPPPLLVSSIFASASRTHLAPQQKSFPSSPQPFDNQG